MKLFLSIIAIFFVFQSCEPKQKETKKEDTLKSIIQTEIDYATCFEIEEDKGIKKLIIKNPFNNYSKQQVFILLKKNQLYSAKNNEIVITVPIQKIIPFSTSYLSMIDTLGELNSIVSVENKNYIYNPKVLKKIKTGGIKEIGSFNTLNIEKIILQAPNLIVSVGNAGTPIKQIQKLEQFNIPNLNNYDWKETHPLGKAEWVKVFGLLYDKELEANLIFNSIKENYNQLKKNAPKSEAKVLFSTMYNGTWYIPGGNSYVAQFVKDAKGTYPWINNTETGSLPLSFETIAAKIPSPNIWLNPNLKTQKELLASDARYQNYISSTKGFIFNNDKRTTKMGGNDYYEKGTLRADLVLKDYITLFSLDIKQKDSLYFFTKIKP